MLRILFIKKCSFYFSNCSKNKIREKQIIKKHVLKNICFMDENTENRIFYIKLFNVYKQEHQAC